MSRLSPLAKPFSVSKPDNNDNNNTSFFLFGHNWEAESTKPPPSKTTPSSWRYPPWDFGGSSDLAPLIDLDSVFDPHESFPLTANIGYASVSSKEAVAKVVPHVQLTHSPPLDSEAASASVHISTSNPVIKNKEGVKDKDITNESKHQSVDHPNTHEVIDPVTVTKLNLKDLNDESELDSPCWKGKMASLTFDVPGPVSPEQLKSGIEKSSTLNPSAPQFFPSSIKKIPNHDELSFMDSAQRSCFSELGNIPETPCYVPESEPLIGEDYFTSIFPFLENANGLSSSETRVCAPLDCTQTHVVVNTMKELSELLVQNSLNNLQSLDDEHLEIIERVVINLTLCMKKRAQIGSTRPSASDLLQKLNNLHKNLPPEVTKKETKHACSTIPATTFDSSSMLKDQMQAIERVMKEHHEVDEENPQVSLYRNLWLEAEAALWSSKYKARVLGTKTGTN